MPSRLTTGRRTQWDCDRSRRNRAALETDQSGRTKMAAGSAAGARSVRYREIARVLILIGLAALTFGCASHHRPAVCRNSAKVVGTDSGGYQGGWVLVRKDQDPNEVAARIAKTFHVRTQSLTYLHGFSTFPMPQDPKFLCDRAVVEVHYDPPQGIAAR